MEHHTPEFLMRNAPMRVHKLGRNERRQVLQIEGKRYIYSNVVRYIYSNVVWNFLNPDNPMVKGDVIHHKDRDVLNDMPDNLQKMTNSNHIALHSSNRTSAARKRIAENQHRVWQRQTHCKRGHPLSGENIRLIERMGKTGPFYWRECQICMKIKRKRFIEKRRRLRLSLT